MGFAPGGGTDTAARIVAKKLTENIGQSVVVENKAGAGGNIAAQQIATAPPDGYTIHLTSVGPMTVAPHMVKNLPYDPKRDIAPITMGVIFPNVIVVQRRRAGEDARGVRGAGQAEARRSSPTHPPAWAARAISRASSSSSAPASTCSMFRTRAAGRR